MATEIKGNDIVAAEEKTEDFETTLGELEKIVKELEGEVKLEVALALFDRGMKLSQSCEEFLKAAEQKIEVLKRTANGVIIEKFEDEKTQES